MTSMYLPRRMRLQGHFILLCAVHTIRAFKYIPVLASDTRLNMPTSSQ